MKKSIIFLILILTTMIFTCGCTTPQRYEVETFDLDVNESVTYNIDLERNLIRTIMGCEDRFITDCFYAHTTTLGTYQMSVTTNDVDSKASVRWVSAHQYLVTDDKFGHTHYAPVAKWGGGIRYTCDVDKTQDCSLPMSIDGGVTSPDLQIYIMGNGMANMKITRVA